MAKSLSQPQFQIWRTRRYSLRTLFIASAVAALPFLVVANMGGSLRPEQSVASPLYLLFGIACVVLAAALGSATGSKIGMFAAACMAAVGWIGLILIFGLFSDELMAALPAHAVGAVATVVVLAVVVRSGETSGGNEQHTMLLKLLSVKHDIEEARQAKNLQCRSAEASIRSAEDEPQF